MEEAQSDKQGFRSSLGVQWVKLDVQRKIGLENIDSLALGQVWPGIQHAARILRAFECVPDKCVQTFGGGIQSRVSVTSNINSKVLGF